jgi:hypothetical protein
LRKAAPRVERAVHRDPRALLYFARHNIYALRDQAVAKKLFQIAIHKIFGGVVSPAGEFPDAWIEDQIGLGEFRLRGPLKAGIEGLWACPAYTVKQWIRLARRTQPLAACAT